MPLSVAKALTFPYLAIISSLILSSDCIFYNPHFYFYIYINTENCIGK
nr:MAG TPA: hypothetical protein [Caudoviricetes sp.]